MTWFAMFIKSELLTALHTEATRIAARDAVSHDNTQLFRISLTLLDGRLSESAVGSIHNSSWPCTSVLLLCTM